MRRFHDSIMRLVLVGFFIAVILAGGRITKADYIFVEPVNLRPVVNSLACDEEPGISAVGLELYLASNRPGGSGKNLETGTFFDGLIDDVCIYNMALTADKIEAIAG